MLEIRILGKQYDISSHVSMGKAKMVSNILKLNIYPITDFLDLPLQTAIQVFYAFPFHAARFPLFIRLTRASAAMVVSNHVRRGFPN